VAELAAFTAENVCRLTKLSPRQVRYWAKTGFFAPSFLNDRRRRAFGRIYSFRDVVGLRTIAMLRNEHGVPLQELRRVGKWFQSKHDTPWSSLKFALRGREVVFYEPGSGVAVEPRGAGQEVLSIALEPIAAEMRSAADKLRERREEQLGQLARNRYVVHNAWVLAGTRIPTSAIWNYHEAGYTSNQIIREYPRLTASDIAAAIKFEEPRHRVA
jgi:uncharacterized protein (DUF433 family)